MRAILLATLMFACSANDDVPQPTLSGALPDRGVPGTVITVSGSSLCQIAHEDDHEGTPFVCPDSEGAVYFGSHLGTSLAWEDTAIMAEVPVAAPGGVDLRVQVNGRATNSIEFVVE